MCARAFSPYLRTHGFGLGHSDNARATFRKGRCLLSFTYEPETSPRYTLHIEIGLKRRWFSTRPLETVALWRAPHADGDSAEWLLDFRSAEQLEAVARRARGLLETHARPLWENEARLEELLLQAWTSMKQEHDSPANPAGGFSRWSQRVRETPVKRD